MDAQRQLLLGMCDSLGQLLEALQISDAPCQSSPRAEVCFSQSPTLVSALVYCLTL